MAGKKEGKRSKVVSETQVSTKSNGQICSRHIWAELSKDLSGYHPASSSGLALCRHQVLQGKRGHSSSCLPPAHATNSSNISGRIPRQALNGGAGVSHVWNPDRDRGGQVSSADTTAGWSDGLRVAGSTAGTSMTWHRKWILQIQKQA